MQKKAIIAMSGGVDSSVAAYLMIQAGYDCAGATMKLYDKPQCSQPGDRSCCTPSDTEDARNVAARLGILYYVFPMHEEFRHHVIDKFASTYLNGGTPNPCIDCNRFLKFDDLIKRAQELYCQRSLRTNPTGSRHRPLSSEKRTGSYQGSELCTLFHDSGSACPYTFPPGNLYQGRNSSDSSGTGLHQCRQTGQSGYLFCP